MRSELLRNRVMLQRPQADQDAAGQPLAAWLDVAPLWADIRHQRGLEAIKADAPASVVKASIRLRYRSGLDAGMRFLHKGVAYEIKAILPDELHKEYVDVACEVVV